MKKLMVIVALITLIVNATQAQTGAITIINPAPKAYVLSNTQDKIMLNGSEKNVSYQLYTLDTTGKEIAISDPIKGTGSPLTILVEKQGAYTMDAISDHGCSTKMIGSARIIEKTLQTDPIPTNTPTDEEYSFETRDGAIIIMFLFVFLCLLYGIINRNRPTKTNKKN